MRRPSTIASTSYCGAASTCSISMRGWAPETAFVSIASSTSWSRAGARPCCAADGCRHRCTSPARFSKMKCLGLRDKLGIARALLAIRRERTTRQDLDRISMSDWLLEKRQTPRAMDRFWRQVLVSAINEDLDRMAARHGFQVMWLGFLARADAYEMGVPAVPLAELYASTGGSACRACTFICALRWRRLARRGSWWPASGRRATTTFGTAFRAAGGGGFAGARARSFADHRRPPLVRSRSDHAPARHAARPHHAMDVQ